mgnify:CR=1 FL=1
MTAADKKTKTTYTVNFSVEQLKDNTLSDILIDGEPLIDFRPTKNSYIVELPLGTTSVPSVQAVSAYAAGEQTITYTDNGLTGTYKISVSAPGNSVVREYKLSFIIKPSSYVMLKDLAVEGYPITFESGRKVYYVELPSGTQENNLPAITWVAGDKYQTIAQLPLEKDEDNNLISKIQVTAASGDVLVYKVIFIINRSSYAYLDGIQVAGQPLAGFSPTQSQYEMELPIATTTLPAITYTKGDEFQTVTISNSPIDEVDHTASSRLTVTAENGDVFIYVINYTIAQADNTTLKAIYVNGYEFKELTNGVLNIRLQQFDAGYQYFTIQALDHAGNMSEVYKTANPYYTDPEKEGDSDKKPAEQLPVKAEPTKPTQATGTVTEHTKTDSNGNSVVKKDTASEQKDKKEENSSTTVDETKGKEFYTIQTASEKVFYLVIDRDGENETVYFLTEISENDLLNTTSDNSQVLPMNSAAVETAIPTDDTALGNNNNPLKEQESGDASVGGDDESGEPETGDAPDESAEAETEKPKTEKKGINPYIVMAVIGALVVAGYYFLVLRKKKDDFAEEDEDDTNPDIFDQDDMPAERGDDFFDNEEDYDEAEETDQQDTAEDSEEN